MEELDPACRFACDGGLFPLCLSISFQAVVIKDVYWFFFWNAWCANMNLHFEAHRPFMMKLLVWGWRNVWSVCLVRGEC